MKSLDIFMLSDMFENVIVENGYVYIYGKFIGSIDHGRYGYYLRVYNHYSFWRYLKYKYPKILKAAHKYWNVVTGNVSCPEFKDKQTLLKWIDDIKDILYSNI